MDKSAIIAVLALAAGSPAFADQPIRVEGCVEAGVESGCLVLRAADGKVYNVTAARPAPAVGAFGEIAGTIKRDAMSICMQGLIVSPAAWTAKQGACPK
jgi:hypothetical protein